MYNKVLAFFLALPEDKQVFIDNYYFDSNLGTYCALGALEPTLTNLSSRENRCSLRNLDAIYYQRIAFNFDITLDEAAKLQQYNDSLLEKYYKPRSRFIKVIEWLKKEIEHQSYLNSLNSDIPTF